MTLSPLARLQRRLPSVPRSEIEEQMLCFPTATSHRCWVPKVANVHIRGSSTTVQRYAMEVLTGAPLHITHLLRTTCKTKRCANPAHAQIQLRAYRDEWEAAPVPPRLIGIVQTPASETAEAEVEDVIDMILSIEDGRDLEPSQLHDRFADAGIVYEIEVISLALARIKSEGL